MRRPYSEKREDLPCALVGGCWHGKDRAVLTLSRCPMSLVSKHIWILLVGPELETKAKLLRKLPSPEYAESIARRGCSGFAFWTGSVAALGQGSFVICGLSIVNLHI